jgi:hypothetical protein
MGLVRSFANMADSVSFVDSHYGGPDCCWQTLLMLRPGGDWSFVRVDSTARWFDAPADSVAFRRVLIRLLQLGFVHDWPVAYESTTDVSEAFMTLWAPGQCHENTSALVHKGKRRAAEWNAARAVLDSLATNTQWRQRRPPDWAPPNRFLIATGFRCGM